MKQKKFERMFKRLMRKNVYVRIELNNGIVLFADKYEFWYGLHQEGIPITLSFQKKSYTNSLKLKDVVEIF